MKHVSVMYIINPHKPDRTWFAVFLVEFVQLKKFIGGGHKFCEFACLLLHQTGWKVICSVSTQFNFRMN